MVQIEHPPFYVRFKLREIAHEICSDEWRTAYELCEEPTEEALREMTGLLETLAGQGIIHKALAQVGDDKQWVYRCA